ncbi:hypothetical protein O7626_29415 [Micromonospora sp. WMMD1102]|uniref:hypothetical protein n=1 Tax=Micromonospora sp. WMMD1102 TaxID=3016105 RepID=UPI002414EBA8|nr:hypothetical protein [Micromonospora sp. WMMD1102]MDG4789993.1 hypothetical protein [Micromonospora sp. WMMD1102]
MASADQIPALLFVLTVYLALSAVGLGVLYWVVRLAVRHAIEDADRRRSAQRTH